MSHGEQIAARRTARQELCAAMGMSLRDGSPIVVGGEKCPPTPRIAEALCALGLRVTRIGREERSDRYDDTGITARYAVDGLDALPEAIREILARDIQANTVEGDDLLADLLIGWPTSAITARTR